MKLFSLVLLFIISLVSDLSAERISRCGERVDQEADSRIAQMISVAISRNVPETEPTYNQYCYESGQNLAYLRNYTRNCLETVSRQIFSTIFFTLRRTYKRFCRKGAYQSEFVQSLLRHGKCFNKARPLVIRCHDSLIDHLDGIVNAADDRMKIPMSCCNWFVYRRCVLDIYEDVCSRDAVQMVEKLVDQNSESALSIVCNDLDEASDSCNKLIPLIPSRHRSLPRSRSPLFPVLKILTSIQ